MDLNDLRSAVTLVSLLLFLGLVRWAWSRQRRAAFDDAAQLPFHDEERADAPGTERSERT